MGRNVLSDIGLDEDSSLDLVKMLTPFHNQFLDCFSHVNLVDYRLAYLLGILSDLKKKLIEAIALRFLGEEKVRILQKFMRNSPWDEDKGKLKLQSLQYNQFYTNDGMITIDSFEELKKGNDSPGEAPQYIGCAGINDNGQSGLYLGFTGSKGYGLIDRRLYLPERWFNDEYKEPRENCLVPEELAFKTKPVIALELLEEIEKKGFCCKWVGVDATFGSSCEFLDAIRDRKYFIASVRSNTKVWIESPEAGVPPYKGVGRRPTKPIPLTPSIQVKDIFKHCPDFQMEEVILNRGAHGYTICEIGITQVIECRDNLPGSEVWLIVLKFSNDYKYLSCNAPADTPKGTLNRRIVERWPIAQCFKLKYALGMNEFMGRSWPGWHRHMTYVLMGLFFTTKSQQDYLLTTEKDPYGYIDIAYEPKPAEERQNKEVSLSKPTAIQESSGALEAQPPKEEPFTPIDATDTSSTNLEGSNLPPKEIAGPKPLKPTTTANWDQNSSEKVQIPILSLYMVSLLINNEINRTYPNITNTIERKKYYLKSNSMSL